MICVSASGFLDLLTRAQCCRVDDQRGLLTKEQLELPLFLQQSLDLEKPPENQAKSSSATESRKAETEESGSESTQSSAGTAEKTPDSKSEGKNLKETAV